MKKQELVEDEPVEPVIQSDGPEPGSKEWEYVDEAIENVNLTHRRNLANNY